MASTITASTLKITIREDIKLNGVQQGGVNTLEIGSVNEIYKRIVTCPASTNTTIATFRSATNVSGSSGTTVEGTPLDLEDVKYIRVTNLDDSEHVGLSLKVDAGEADNAPDESANLLLEAGQSFMMGSPHDGIDVDITAGAPTQQAYNLEDLASIVINTEVASGVATSRDIEIFVASV
jgi:hypothetical protein|tara:strand:+ start:256 stop:792 length:537 start_codon:yes stop_codon:yes gene_type:complete